jgi:hypothetical protein
MGIEDGGDSAPAPGPQRITRRNAQMTEPIAQNRSQMLAAKRWMDDEAGMERASLSPAEYVAYRMKISAADAEALVAAVYALEGDAEAE